MDIEKILNLLEISNISLVSRETGIPNDRMQKWKQGKGKPKIKDYNTLVAYFNGISSEKMEKPNREIELLELLLNQKDETIKALKAEIQHLEERLSCYEIKTKQAT